MENCKINKITLFLFVFILPFLMLLMTLKGVKGNFSTDTSLQETLSKNVFEYSGHPFEFSRTRSLFSTTVSIATNFDLHLSKTQIIFARGDIGKSNNFYFSWAPPGTALVGAFFYKIFSLINFGQFGAYLSILLVSLLILYLIFYIVYNYINKDIYTALLCGYLYIFSTIAFVYSITYFQHQYTILFLLIIILGILKEVRNEKQSAFFSYITPICYGISALFDYPNLIILAPAFLGYLMTIQHKKEKLVRSIIFVTLPLSIIILFHQLNFNNPFQTTNTLISGFNTSLTENFLQKEKNNIDSIFSFEKMFFAIKNYLFYPERGFFFFSPVMILGLLYIRPFFKKRPQLMSLFLLTIFSTLFLYTSFHAPLGGWCFGPRYLLPIYLIFSILTGLWIRKQNKKTQIIILPLVILSIANNLSGTITTLTIPETIDTFFYGIKNLEFVINNTSGSFVYNQFIAPLPLIYYFLVILLIIIFAISYFIFSKEQLETKNFCQTSGKKPKKSSSKDKSVI